MVAHLDAVTSLAVDPNGLYLMSGSKYSQLSVGWGFFLIFIWGFFLSLVGVEKSNLVVSQVTTAPSVFGTWRVRRAFRSSQLTGRSLTSRSTMWRSTPLSATSAAPEPTPSPKSSYDLWPLWPWGRDTDPNGKDESCLLERGFPSLLWNLWWWIKRRLVRWTSLQPLLPTNPLSEMCNPSSRQAWVGGVGGDRMEPQHWSSVQTLPLGIPDVNPAGENLFTEVCACVRACAHTFTPLQHDRVALWAAPASSASQEVGCFRHRSFFPLPFFFCFLKRESEKRT